MLPVEPHGERLGVGKQAEVFLIPEGVLKLYKAGAPKTSAFREAAHLAIVEAERLPAPRVIGVGRVEERWGLVMTLAPGEAFATSIDRTPNRADEHLAAMARLHSAIHRCSGNGIATLEARLRRDLMVAPLDDGRRAGLLCLLEDLSVGDNLCHGDFHPWNVLGAPEDAIVVDWLDAARGAPAADASRSYLLMLLTAPALAVPYLDHYRSASGISEEDVLAWLPVLAGARLAEGVDGEAVQLRALIGP
jgi:hypothetical protein